jgi:hypothetical protein
MVEKIIFGGNFAEHSANASFGFIDRDGCHALYFRRRLIVRWLSCWTNQQWPPRGC